MDTNNHQDAAEENTSEQALLKEKQPYSAEDLSSIHNTHATGTSGGDQRTKDVQPAPTTKNPNPVITDQGNPQSEPQPPASSNPQNCMLPDDSDEKTGQPVPTNQP